MKCCICGKKIEGYGNNPAPVKDYGQCCDECNRDYVIPARMNAIRWGHQDSCILKKRSK